MSQVDPCTNAWDPLDAEMMRKLDTRRWVSMALERAIQAHAEDTPRYIEQDHPLSDLQNLYGPKEDKLVMPDHDVTVFDAKMPGIMTLGEIRSQIDLGGWRLRLGNQIAHLEVG